MHSLVYHFVKTHCSDYTMLISRGLLHLKKDIRSSDSTRVQLGEKEGKKILYGTDSTQYVIRKVTRPLVAVTYRLHKSLSERS